MSYETKTLDLIQVAAQRIIPQQMLDRGYGGRWDVHTRAAYDMDALVVTMVGYLAADHLETVKIAYPRDWWEAVKARFAPAWFLKRWPVREQRHEIRLDAVYPKMALPADKYGGYARIVRHTQDWSAMN